MRVTNCGTDDPAAATLLIQATQAVNTRSKNDKTYHLVFSFPPGEQPPLDVLQAIEDDLCASIGYADHQRISAVHIDTDHLHVHVAINKVHPTGYQNIEPYFDQRRLMEACERLEIQYGLERTNHGIGEKQHERRDRIQLGPEQRPDDRDTRFRRYLRESYNLPIAERPEPKPSTVCESCPAAIWHVLPRDLRCYCRAMHVLVYSNEEQNTLTACDGREMAIEQMLAQAGE